MLRMVHVTPDGASVVEVEDELENYYKLLDCDMIEIPSRKIGGKYFDIICDEEGLLKDNPVISAINIENWEPMLVGKLLICHGNNETGELEGLSDEDIDLVMNNNMRIFQVLRDEDGKEEYSPVFVMAMSY